MATMSGGDHGAGPGLEPDGIELLADAGRHDAAREAGPVTEQVGRPAARWRTGAAVGAAVLAIAGAVAGLSQLGGGTPAPTTPDPATTLAPPPGAAAAELSPFSDLPADLPTELPGLLVAFDSLGSLVMVDRADDRPAEVRLGLIPDPGGGHGLGLGGTEPVWFAQDFSRGSLLGAVGPSGDPLAQTVDLRRLGAGSEVLVTERSPGTLEAAVVPIDFLGTRENNDLRWTLPPDGVRILGVWNGQLLVTQGATTWLLATSGSGPSPAPVVVGPGEVLGFDGRWLVRRTCAQPGVCGLAIGPPGQPDQLQVPAPVVAVAPGVAPSGPGTGAPAVTTSTAPAAPPEPQVGSWTGPVAVAPDGARLAAAVRFGDLIWLTVVDLATGAVERYDSSLSPGALLAWAPDGEWLAFQTGRDLQIRRQRDGRTWILGLDRDLVTLRWSPGPAR
ncbi:MAG: hypothetical protein R2761_22630 [Acidimicrobiales bacterium]